MELAKVEGKKLEDIVVFILVDGIQELQHQLGAKDSEMKRVIDSVAEVVNSAPFFCIAAIAGTFYSNAVDVLNSPPQWRIFLTPPAIDGSLVISSDDPLVLQLVEDMGGHGRALETLVEVLRITDIQTSSLSLLMNNIRVSIETKYPQLINIATTLIPALLAVILRQPLQDNNKIANSELTVETVVSLGFFRIENNRLACPFVLVWLLATWSKFTPLSQFKLESYNELQKHLDPEFPFGMQCWQNWEEFTGRFRILKSNLLCGSTLSMAELHKGAIFGSNAQNFRVKVSELKNLFHASHQNETKGKQTDLNFQIKFI